MPTFGKTSIGATINNFPPGGKSASRFTLTDAARATKFTVYFKGTDVAHVGGNARCVCYSTSAGAPDALVGVSDIVNVPDNVDQWVDFLVSTPFDLLAGDYYLGIICASTLRGAMDTAGTNSYNSDTNVSAPSNPWGTNSSSTLQKSIYLTYDVIGTTATFGKTALGGTVAAFPIAQNKSVSKFTLPANGNVVKLTIYFEGTHATHTGGNAQGLIYGLSGAEPGALLGTSDVVNVPDGVDQWLDFPFPSTVALTAGDYYLGIIAVSALASRSDTTGTNRFNADTYDATSDFASDPFGTPTSSTTQKNIYATYTTGAILTSSVGAAVGTGLATGAGLASSTGTFGKTALGGAVAAFPFAQNKSVSKFTLTENGSVTKLTTYFKGTHVSHVGGNTQAVIYGMSGTEPGALLAISNVVNVADGVDQWVDFVLPSAVPLTAGDYYLGVISINQLSSLADTAGTNRYNADTYDASTDFASDPFGTPTSSTTQKNIYATYSVGAMVASGAGAATGVGTATGRAPYRSVASATGAGEATGASSSSINVNISFIGSVSAGGTTLTIPTHQTGDLLMGFAFRAGSTIPIPPTGWDIISSGTGGGRSSVMAYRIATAPGTAFGTWSSAEGVSVAIYRNYDISSTPPTGVFDADAGSTAAITYAGLTLDRTNNTSWVGAFAGIGLGASSDINVPPTGMTNRSSGNSSVVKVVAHDTNGAVNVWSLKNQTLNADGLWRTVTYEIYGTTGGTPPADLGKQYGRPVSDIALDGWVASTGTQIAPTLDEEAPVDADYALSPVAPTTDTAIVLLSPLQAPLNTTGPYTIRVRAREVAAGSTIHVGSGGSIQAAINSAAPGSIITIAANTVYDLGTSPLLITKPITITTAGWSFNGRVGLAQKSLMGQIQMTSGNQVIIVRGGAATDVTLRGLYVAGPGNVIINLGENDTPQPTYDEMPTRCTVDQCIVNGEQPGVVNTGYHGVMLHCAYGNVYRSHIYNIYRTGTDSTGVGGVNGTGPYNIIDNYINAASENILFGGVTPQIDYNIPADILIENNTLEKDPRWMDLSFGGQGGIAIKNMVEFKTGRRCIVRNNSLGYQWFSGQGYSFVVTPSQYSGPPWQICEDILFEKNVVGPTCGGMNLLGHGQNQTTAGRATLVSQRITVRDNWFIVDMDAYLPGQSKGTGRFFLFGNGMKDLVVEYNTVEQRGGGAVWVEGTTNGQGGYPTGHILRRNIIHQYGTYGTHLYWGDTTANPPVNWTSHSRGVHFFDYFPGAIAVENALIGAYSSSFNTNMPGNLTGTATTYPASLIVNGYGTGPLAGYGRRP